MQTTLQLAGLRVQFCHRAADLARFGAAYLAKTTAPPDLTLSVTDEEIERARTAPEGARLSVAGGESLALYRKLAEAMPRFDGFFFHAAVVQTGGLAYAFAGKSGVGKSTHSRLWQTFFGATYVNGDKPILRLTDGRFYACGTPWAGKEPGQHAPVNIPLAGICFLSQGKENEISPLPPSAAAGLLLRQTLLAPTEEVAARQMDLLSDLTRLVPLWRMTCNISHEAAALSYTTMTGGAERI